MNTLLLILLIALIVYVFWLFKTSKNDFFKQDDYILAKKRKHLIDVLADFGIDVHKDPRWLMAYDAFWNYPSVYVYDGATIVNDNDTIKGYDAPAANHDYWYLENKKLPVLQWLKGKLQADYQYGLDMRALDVNYITAWSRVIALWISTPIYLIVF